MIMITVLGALGLSGNYLTNASENLLETKRSMLSMGVSMSDKVIPFLIPSVDPINRTPVSGSEKLERIGTDHGVIRLRWHAEKSVVSDRASVTDVWGHSTPSGYLGRRPLPPSARRPLPPLSPLFLGWCFAICFFSASRRVLEVLLPSASFHSN